MTFASFESFNDRDLDLLREVELATGVTIEMRNGPFGDERALLVEDRDLTLADLDSMPALRALYLLESGRATLPLNRLESRSIALRRVPNLSGLGVAEHVFALMLALKKQLLTAHKRVVENVWRSDVTEPLFTDQRAHVFNWSGVENIGWLHGETLGIVGFGRIGHALARRAQAFDMDVLYYNRYRLAPSEERRLAIVYADLGELVTNSDVITLNLPFSSSSEHLIGAAQFACMKPSALLINAARGRVVDEEALFEALRARRIAGAGLDVLTYEPPRQDNPLLSMENVIFSPHSAGIFDPIARRHQLLTVLNWWSQDFRAD